MIYQLRTYKLFAHNKEAFYSRFRDHALGFFKKYGLDLVAAWETVDQDQIEFIYLLRWPDRESLERGWAGFRADEAWKAIKDDYLAKYGDVVGGIEEKTMLLADVSPKFE